MCISACRPESALGTRLERRGDEISAAGQLFHSGTRAILWNDPGGYDAYRAHRHFQPDKAAPTRRPGRLRRFGSFRGGLPEEITDDVRRRGWTLADLQRVVTQVVVHFDACGTSRRCFEVLHDLRGLSCHFLLDLDGTLYQTLDLKERAWHATHANDTSVGIEIAHIGAYGDPKELEAWYVRDEEGVRIRIPEDVHRGGLPADFACRPRRNELFRGTINGHDVVQYDFTEAQYRALEKVLITLCRIFPAIRARVPRDDGGRVLDSALPPDELRAFRGIVAHWHVQKDKVDPGPAFDWDRILAALEAAGIPGQE